MIEEDFWEFCKRRWPETNGKPVCVRCGHGETYCITTRKKFKCKKCLRQFSPTSGTVWAWHKVDFTTLSIASTRVGKVEVSTRSIAIELGCEWKTANLIRKRFGIPKPPHKHKVRETRYPFVLSPDIEGYALIKAVTAAVDRSHVPEHIRQDVCQDLIVAVLSGEMDLSQVSGEARKFVNKHYQEYANKFRDASLNLPVFGSKDPAIWMDNVESDAFHL